jgi:hypothetical protein
MGLCCVADALAVGGSLLVGCGVAGDSIKYFVGGMCIGRSRQWGLRDFHVMRKYESVPMILYEGFIERFKQIINRELLYC